MELLKLIAFDEDDLKVIAALAQDSVLKVADIVWFDHDKRFAIQINRFVWEKALTATTKPRQGFLSKKAGKCDNNERRRSILLVDRVLAVNYRGFDSNDKHGVLELLTINYKPANDDVAGEINLVFAGTGEIRLKVECIDMQICDLGSAWATDKTPAHNIDDN